MLLISLVLLLLSLIECGLCRNETEKATESYITFEKSFISDLENYIESQESVLQLLRKKLLNFKVEHSDAIENPEAYFSNELNKFLLVKRLSSDINLLSEKTFEVANRFKSKVDAYKQEKLLPTTDDLLSSALSIARLQKAQNLRTDKLAKGIFGNVKRRSGLSTEDCYQVGKQLNTARVYSLAIEWLTEAMKRYDDYYDQHQLKAIEILEELAMSFMGNNQISEAERIVEKIFRMNANSHVIRILRTNQREKRSPPEAIPKSKANKKKFCHLNHFLSSNIFTCPI